jgi:hypothetical protein
MRQNRAFPAIFPELMGLAQDAREWHADCWMGVVHMVVKSKSLFRDALAGFALGVLVVASVALATWSTRNPTAQVR